MLLQDGDVLLVNRDVSKRFSHGVGPRGGSSQESIILEMRGNLTKCVEDTKLGREIEKRPGWANARDSVTTYRLLYAARATRCMHVAEAEACFTVEDVVCTAFGDAQARARSWQRHLSGPTPGIREYPLRPWPHIFPWTVVPTHWNLIAGPRGLRSPEPPGLQLGGTNPPPRLLLGAGP